ncbi:endoglucanase 12-like [Asparagus officinalis]|uniref:endoglucanase 12-like n=1 Tax=Asparagus officinalis TaxID=4686 RepID=UPI00098E0DAC|nr:endoglucanase 12-like [Asparagus officinalis]
MHSANHWGGSFEIHADATTDDEHSHNLDVDRAALSRQHTLDETQQSWLLGPQDTGKKDKYVDLGCIIVKRKVLWWAFWTALVAFIVIGIPVIVVKTLPKHKEKPPPPDEYSKALHKALMFFNAQRSGRLPKNNGVRWRGNSALNDGSDLPDVKGGLVGGYSVGVVSRCLANLGKEHWAAVKWILRYLRGTSKKCLCF